MGRRKFDPLDPDCPRCDERQLGNVLFDMQVQHLLTQLSKLVGVHQLHAHGPGMALVAYRRRDSEAVEYVDGVTLLQALERAVKKLNPTAQVR